MSIARLLTFVAALSLTGAASANVIVDTGPGAVPYTGGYTLSSGQWLGAEFTLTSATTISQVDGWIGGYTGTLHAAILSESFATLYSQQTSHVGSSTSSWVGAEGVSWNLGPGNYYAAFEVLPGDTFYGAMDPSLKPNPIVTQYVSSFTQGSLWHDTSNLSLGLQILGEKEAAVPEPSTIALIGLGLAGVAFGTRKKA